MTPCSKFLLEQGTYVDNHFSKLIVFNKNIYQMSKQKNAHLIMLKMCACVNVKSHNFLYAKKNQMRLSLVMIIQHQS